MTAPVDEPKWKQVEGFEAVNTDIVEQWQISKSLRP
jgi:hypothetical protein